MKASTKYDTLIGTSSADISNLIHGAGTLDNLVKDLKSDFDFEQYTPVGLSINGEYDYDISVIAVDNFEKNKERIVDIILPIPVKDFKRLFRNFKVVLYEKNGKNYEGCKIEEEIIL